MNSYNSDQIWRQVQNYLPKYNQLSSETMPEEYFIDIYGMWIHIDHYKPTSPKAKIILFHGVGGNGRILSFIAVPFFKNGYEVICPDLPLYGYTEANGKVIYDTWVTCGKEIVDYYQRKNNLPTFLFGLSAGGMLAYQITTECQNINGLMLTCILDHRIPIVTQQTANSALMATISKILLAATYKIVGNIKIPMKAFGKMKAITNNEKLATILMKDKKSSGVMVPLAFIHTMLTPKIKIEPEKFMHSPVLLVHPTEDHWTDINLSLLFFDKIKSKKEVKLLDGAGHFPIEEKGLIDMEKYCVDFIESNL